MIYLFVSFLGLFFSILIPRYVPIYYAKVKSEFIKNASDLSEQQELINKRPVLAFLFMIPPIVFFFTHTNFYFLSLFMFVLSVSAYIDSVCKWVPDVIIYLCVWVSFLALYQNLGNVTLYGSLISPVVVVLVMSITNAWAKHKGKNIIFGSGDLYLSSSVALWVNPFFIMLYISLCFSLATVFTRKVGEVAFVPYLYLVFCIYLFIVPCLGVS